MNEPDVPVREIIAFTQSLIRKPSRAGEDDPEDIIGTIASWAKSNKVSFHKLTNSDGELVGGFLHFASGKPGPVVCLNACIDTCSFGSEKNWKYSPTEAKIENNRLYGRGAADSKIAVAMFCHLFRQAAHQKCLGGELYVLLDADEHTGTFGGIKAFLEREIKPDAVFVGYPGDKEIIIGARGFLRSEIKIFGKAAHSGSRQVSRENAVVKAALLITAVEKARVSGGKEKLFPDGPKVTVTALHGGSGFSQVPDEATLHVDIRLTPKFDCVRAEAWLTDLIHTVDKKYSPSYPSLVSFHESWPAYVLKKNHPLVVALKKAAEQEMGRGLPLCVCGPSNIGNLLASHGIPAVCGFGVSYENVHGANESIDLSSIVPTYRSYRRAVTSLLTQEA